MAAAAIAASSAAMRPMPVESSSSDLRVVNNQPRSLPRLVLSSRGRAATLVVALVAVTAVSVVLTRSHVPPPRSGPLPTAAELTVDNATLTFVAIGDWGRGGDDHQRAVGDTLGGVAAIVNSSFVVSVGDNFYDYGVSSARDPLFDDSWRLVYTHPALAGLQWYAVAGNHDYRGSLRGQIEYSHPRWSMPGLNYSLTWGNTSSPASCVAAVFIDTCPFISSYWKGKEDKGDLMANLNASSPAAQLAWAGAALAAGAAACDALVVVGHHPLYSGGEHGDSADLIAAYGPLFDAHGVDAMLAGHDHTLIHLEAARGGTQFTVTGAGSKIRTNTVTTPQTLWHADVNGFTVHSFNGTHAGVAYVHGLDGTLLFKRVTPLRGKGRGR